ncbi:MAG: DUF393 domain-containing protein [Pseudomonadota bacterium]
MGSLRDEPLKIYYDGVCRICSVEVNHYKRLNTGALSFVDISAPGFEREPGFPSTKRLNKYFHVQLPSGEFVDGVDAFIEIWSRLPQYKWAGKIAKTKAVHTALSGGYKVFAEVRPWLPKKKRPDCEEGHCPV